MPKTGGMLAQVRQQAIADLVNQQGNITVNELCSRFEVSPATIRNDLRDLEARGSLKRTHGGAVGCKKSAYELNTYQKEVQNIDEKCAIAKAAMEFIHEGDAIALDSGTTTFEIAQLLAGLRDITVVTNDLQIASWLERYTTVTVILAGGTVRRHFRCTTGQQVIDMLSTLHVDKAFVAANGVSIKNGLTTPNVDMAAVKKQIIESADKVILIADSSKIERKAFVSYAPISEVDVLITDEHADNGFTETLRGAGITVVCAETDNKRK
jgi:DeoR family fructose operon transcriptional repressor